jgi:hypothetical protein
MKNILLIVGSILISLSAFAQPCNITSNTVSTTSPTICTGSSAQINGSTPSGSATFTYSWLQSTVGAAGPYTPISGQTGISYTTAPLTANRWYKRIVNILCTPSGSDSDTSAALAITVNANNTTTLTSAANTNSQTVCINTAITQITYSTVGATGINSSGSNLPAGVNASWSNNTITISGTPTVSGTFAYSILLTGGCGTVNVTGTITVQALPTVNVGGATPPICQGATSATLGGSFGGSATGATWTIQTINNGTITSSNNPSNATFTAAPNAPSSVTLILTSTGGVCSPVSSLKTITVNPNPSITSALNQTICSGTSFTISPSNGSGNIIPSGTTYTWLTPTISGGVTGGSAQPTGQTSISQTLSNPTNTNQTATYAITASSNGCSGNFNSTITVNPKPNITSLQTQTVCSDNSFSITPTNGNGNIVPSSTTYTWSAPSVSGINNSSSGSNSATIFGDITNTTNSAITVPYNVTPTAGTCEGNQFTASITVNPVALILSSNPPPICSGESFGPISPSNGNGNIVPNGTTYTWTVSSNPNLTGASAQSGTGVGSISQTVTNTINTQQQITYTIIPSSGNCPGSSFSSQVTVNPKPSVANQSLEICSDSSFTLSPTNGGGNIIPAGTIYSWSAPINAEVNGLLASTNASVISGNLFSTTYENHSITYSVTPSTTQCTGSPFNVNVTLLRKPNIIAIEDQQICSGNSVQLYAADLFGNQNLFYNWSQSPNVSTLNFPYIPNPIASPLSNSTYFVRVIDPNTQCLSTDSVSVAVIPVADLVISSSLSSLCEGDTAELSLNNLQADWYANGQLLASNVSQVEVSPAVSTVYNAVFQNASCTVEDDFTLVVNPKPNTSIVGNSEVCENSYWQFYHVNSSQNHSFNWEIQNGEIMSGQGTNAALIHWYDGTEGSLSVNEYIWETGCNADAFLQTTFSGSAPDMVSVIELQLGSNILICEDSTFTIYKWGYESKINPGPIYVCSNIQYCQFSLYDPANYYYFVEHGFDSECLTRSYLTPPPEITTLAENTISDDFIVYPNPFKDEINFKLTNLANDPFSLNIISFDGRIIRSFNNIKDLSSFNLQELMSGIYIFEFHNKNNTIRKILTKI